MYAELHDLKNRLGALFTQIYPETERAIDDLLDAQAEIDGVLTMRYQIPVTCQSAMPLLKSWTLTLAEERAYARTDGARFPEKVKARVAQVRARLTEIREESFCLPGAAEQTKANIAFLEMETPVFSRKNLKNF